MSKDAYYGMTCAVCHRTLMPGGNERQKPHWVRIGLDGKRLPSWESDDEIAISEARCIDCKEGA